MDHVITGRGRYAAMLRQELIARNSSYAGLNLLPHVTSYGDLPVVVYQQSECGRHHGNFISPATEQFSEGHTGKGGLKKYTTKVDVSFSWKGPFRHTSPVHDPMARGFPAF